MLSAVTKAILRSAVWFGAVLWLAYLKRTGTGSWIPAPAGSVSWIGAALLVLGDVIGVCILIGAFHYLVVRVEEPSLRKRLGDQYKDYLQRVPRWIPFASRR